MSDNETNKRLKLKRPKLVYMAVFVVCCFLFLGFTRIEMVHQAPDTIDNATLTGTSGNPCENVSHSCEVSTATSDTVPRGHLISQSERAGVHLYFRPSGNKNVNKLVYSLGKEEIEVPNLVGENIKNATKDTYDLGLEIGDVAMVNDPNYSPGTIVSQSVSPGTSVKNGNVINLKVANVSVTLDDYSGKTLSEAKVSAEEKGLKLSAVEANGKEVKDSSKVISQFPVAGSYVPKGSSVFVSLLDDGADAQGTIPDIIGKSKEEGQKLVAEAGFSQVSVVEVTNSEVNSSQITQVVPGVGSTGSLSSTNVVIIVSNPQS